MKTVYEFFFIQLSQRQIIVDLVVKILSFYSCEFRRFDTLQIEKTRRALIQAVEGSHKISLEEKLESNVFPLIVEK